MSFLVELEEATQKVAKGILTTIIRRCFAFEKVNHRIKKGLIFQTNEKIRRVWDDREMFSSPNPKLGFNERFGHRYIVLHFKMSCFARRTHSS
jgi:hypothetical protein